MLRFYRFDPPGSSLAWPSGETRAGKRFFAGCIYTSLERASHYEKPEKYLYFHFVGQIPDCDDIPTILALVGTCDGVRKFLLGEVAKELGWHRPLGPIPDASQVTAGEVVVPRLDQLRTRTIELGCKVLLDAIPPSNASEALDRLNVLEDWAVEEAKKQNLAAEATSRVAVISLRLKLAGQSPSAPAAAQSPAFAPRPRIAGGHASVGGESGSPFLMVDSHHSTRPAS